MPSQTPNIRAKGLIVTTAANTLTSVHRCLAARTCRDAENVNDPTTGRTIRRGATIAENVGLCETCTRSAQHAIDDMIGTWLALHMAIGESTRRTSQKVATSRPAPININTDADALKVFIVEWLSAAAARVSEVLNIEEPHQHNNTDAEHARIIIACTRILSPNIDKLISLPADDVMVWLTAAETQYPGERLYIDEHGTPHRGIKITPMTGAELALKLTEIRRKARSFLALTTPADKLSLPCPRCNEYELTRRHERRKSKEIDQIECGACDLNWPYEQYRNLTLIWVKEDEMEREKLQKQLETEKTRRELVEWLLAKREWQLSLALDCPDNPAVDAYMSDKDVANLIGVSDSTVRSWATRGQITRHTADDGSIVFLASEVWEFAKTNLGGRAATIRRLTTGRKIYADTPTTAVVDKTDVACNTGGV
jgi:hypothetical protein